MQVPGTGHDPLDDIGGILFVSRQHGYANVLNPNARVEGQIKPASDGSIKDITFDAFDALKEFESTLDDIFSPLVA